MRAPRYTSFPRLYAAASLKLCARRAGGTKIGRFPRLYAAASLKQPRRPAVVGGAGAVFRGFMPRPH